MNTKEEGGFMHAHDSYETIVERAIQLGIIPETERLSYLGFEVVTSSDNKVKPGKKVRILAQNTLPPSSLPKWVHELKTPIFENRTMRKDESSEPWRSFRLREEESELTWDSDTEVTSMSLDYLGDQSALIAGSTSPISENSFTKFSGITMNQQKAEDLMNTSVRTQAVPDKRNEHLNITAEAIDEKVYYDADISKTNPWNFGLNHVKNDSIESFDTALNLTDDPHILFFCNCCCCNEIRENREHNRHFRKTIQNPNSHCFVNQTFPCKHLRKSEREQRYHRVSRRCTNAKRSSTAARRRDENLRNVGKTLSPESIKCNCYIHGSLNRDFFGTRDGHFQIAEHPQILFTTALTCCDEFGRCCCHFGQVYCGRSTFGPAHATENVYPYHTLPPIAGQWQTTHHPPSSGCAKTVKSAHKAEMAFRQEPRDVCGLTKVPSEKPSAYHHQYFENNTEFYTPVFDLHDEYPPCSIVFGKSDGARKSVRKDRNPNPVEEHVKEIGINAPERNRTQSSTTSDQNEHFALNSREGNDLLVAQSSAERLEVLGDSPVTTKSRGKAKKKSIKAAFSELLRKLNIRS